MAKRINNKITNKYEIETQDYMFAINKYLRKKYGEISDEWAGALLMLADNYNTFIQCKNQIEKDGLMIIDRFNTLIKHPLIKVQIDAQIQVVKLLNEFGLSPKSAAKLNDNSDEEDNSIINQFIEKR